MKGKNIVDKKIPRNGCKTAVYHLLSFCKLAKSVKWKHLHFLPLLLNQLGFWPIQHIKRTVWTSVLWKINIQEAKKWPEMVLKQPFILSFSFRNRVSITYVPPMRLLWWHTDETLFWPSFLLFCVYIVGSDWLWNF